jgi:hypothetical protein
LAGKLQGRLFNGIKKYSYSMKSTNKAASASQTFLFGLGPTLKGLSSENYGGREVVSLIFVKNYKWPHT